MFKINRRVEYALIALKYMQQQPASKLTPAKEICEMYHTPFDPTSRVLQLMTQAGILRAEYGAHGGYQVAQDLSKISMYDLTEIIVGPIEIANCFHGHYSRCELTGHCNVISPMLQLNEKLHELLTNTKVTDLISTVHIKEKAIRQKPIKVSEEVTN